MSDSESASLISHLTTCLGIIQDIENRYRFKDTFVVEFKNFLKHFSQCVEEINGSVSLINNHPLKSKVLLSLGQISKTLKLLSSLGDKPFSIHTVWCLCQRLHWCFSELCQIFSGSLCDQTQESEILNSFLRKIDLALHILHTQNEDDLKLWKQIIDDLVYQAITIAKIGSSTDYKEITSVCQNLLKEGSQFIIETSSNHSQLSLLKDSLALSLASLEERVNIAVLRVMLQVSCDSNNPLKHLVQCCGHTAADLDHSIADYDAHMERIILTGQFAISCCEDSTRVAEMKCCLASLEWVDNYLVPAIRAFHSSPHCQSKQNFVQFLCGHWQDQIAILQTCLDAVVDSYAYTQIVINNLNELHENLRQGIGTQDLSHTTIKQSWVLYKHLSKASDYSQNAMDLFKLKQVIYECEVAASKDAPEKTLLKRVQHLISVLNNVSNRLTAVQDEEDQIRRTAQDLIAVKNTITQFRTDEEIKTTERSDLLAPYLNQTSKRHTTFYEKTPRKDIQSLVMKNRGFSSTSGDDDMDSALRITDILENLTILSIASSFNKDIASSATVNTAISTGEERRNFSRKLFSSLRTSLVSVDGSEVTDVSTPKRLEDLRFLDEKIQHLKQS